MRLLRAASLALLTVLLGAAGPVMQPPEDTAYSMEVTDAASPVNEPGTVHVTLHPRDGYRILDGYNHRVIELSSFDDKVKFARKVVPGRAQDDTLVFDIAATPTAPGAHAINGIVRVGYIHGGQEMAMVSMPLIAKVTGTP